MKKTIAFEMNDNSYVILCDGAIITEVGKKELKLNGKELYDKFFSLIPLDEHIELEFNEEKLESSEDKRICSQIKEIFNIIIEKINQEMIN